MTMLKRVLEPEVMDSHEEAHDYDAMDHSAVNRLFVEDLLAATDLANASAASSDILDLGTGTAQIPVELCQQYSDCRVLAVDLAAHMLDLARYNIEAAGLTEQVFLQQIDAKSMPMEDESFDVVMSNSIVHHIPDPSVVLAEAVRVTRCGGWLFVRDLMRPATDEDVRQLVEQYAGDENDHQRQMFDDSLRAALNLEEIQALAESLGFAADTVQATSDRHWTWAARRPE